MAKEPKCKTCGETGHYALSCFQKPIKAPVKRAAVKKVKTPKKKSEGRGQLVKKLDSVFSQYIRISKSDENGNGTCVTCGKFDYWGKLQNGHYYSRGKYPTRWHEDNCHIQCMRCNVMMNGNYTSYALYMFSKYGEDYVMELHRLAQSRAKISTPELREKIVYYKGKVAELLANIA